MAYLDPPPFPAPVIVQKDVGGVVADYQARTEQYRREGREVRLHECRSACTLALGLPNVCVYPSSVLKFHKAYDWNTKIRDEAVSAQLMEAYPAAVQARLGSLTRDYRSLTGAELIALGVRDCGAGQTQMANVKPAKPAIAHPAPETPNLLGAILASLAPSPRPMAGAIAAPVARAAPSPPREADENEVATPPLPPRRPLEFALSVALVADAEIPLPPRRPIEFASVRGFPGLVAGAQSQLPFGVLSYSSFRR